MMRSTRAHALAFAATACLLAPPPAAVSLGAAPADVAVPATDTVTLSPRAWREDVAFLRAHLPAAHIDLSHLLPEERFHRELDGLDAIADTASSDRMLVGFARAVAMVGEGHTAARILDLGDEAFPVLTRVEEDGLRVVRIHADRRDLLGGRVVRIDGRPAAATLDSVSTVISADNEMGAAAWLPLYLVSRGVVAGLGLLDSVPGLTLEVERLDGTVGRIVLRAVPLGEAERLLLGEAPEMTTAGERAAAAASDAGSGNYGFRWMPEEATVLVRIDRLVDERDRPFAVFVDSLVAEIERRAPERVVVDVRRLSGGNHVSFPLLRGLVRTGYDGGGRLFVLIGRHTFSAGQNLVTLLGRHAGPIFVGEPTGGRPNGYGVLGSFTLPNSGLEIRYSRYFNQDSDPADYRHWQAPDLPAPPSVEADLEGRDPALTAALAFDGSLPGLAALAKVGSAFEDRGLDAALAAARDHRAELRRGGWRVESELNRVGYSFLRADRAEDALAVFRLVTETFPGSWNAWDSLAEALAATGRPDEATAAYERSLALNGYNENARRQLRMLALER